MRKFGFKLFSTNLQNNPKIVENGVEFVRANSRDMFIELMVVQTTSAEEINYLAKKFKGLEVRLHAPHNAMGFDTGSNEAEEYNGQVLDMVKKVADLMEAKTFVVHAGCGSKAENLEETARQFKKFFDSRMVVENLPYDADDTPDKMHGNTPKEISYIMDYSGCGFCFDFSHAICAANKLGLDLEKQLTGFYNLKPTVYHLCDGLVDGIEDKHLHFGEGNFPLPEYLHKYTAEDAYITMETGSGMPKDTKAWEADYRFLKNL